jgi:hypothetical protein
METINSATSIRVPRNKGKLVGQKAPFKLKEILGIRIRLQMASRCRELALFNLAVDSKLRACDLIQLRVGTSVTVKIWHRGRWSPTGHNQSSAPQKWLPVSRQSCLDIFYRAKRTSNCQLNRRIFGFIAGRGN